MGLYTGKHLKTFCIEDGIKKINYARINRIVIPNDNYIHCPLNKGAVNRLLWTNYLGQAFNQYCSRVNYVHSVHSQVKHTSYSYTITTERLTPSGIDIPDSTMHLLVYNVYATVNETQIITYEEN